MARLKARISDLCIILSVHSGYRSACLLHCPLFLHSTVPLKALAVISWYCANKIKQTDTPGS